MTKVQFGQVLLLVFMVAAAGYPCYSQDSTSSTNWAKFSRPPASTNAKVNQQPASLQQPAASESPLSDKLELLVRKHSSVSDLGSSGTIQLVWLSPELLDAMVTEYGNNSQMMPAAIKVLKRKVQDKLEWGKALAFLIIFKPKEHSFIGQPNWINDGNSSYPSVVLRGTGNRLAIPQKWSQIIGEGDFSWYSRPTSGYLIFRARDSDGHPYLDPKDFSFSVLTRTIASPPGEGLFDVKAEFHYDLMPVQLQQMVDASLPAGNNSLVAMKQRVPKESAGSEESAYKGSQDYHLYAYEANSASLTRSEVLQIVGLGIAFAQFAVMAF